MAPEHRRQAIIDATLPLLLEHGSDVSTREIAAAACVAEGTIFRVFETKQELIQETIRAALQPDAAIAQLAQLPPDQTLEERVAAIFDVLRGDIRRTRSLLAHLVQPAELSHRSWPAFNPHEAKHRLAAAADLALAPYADGLAVPTTFAGHLLTVLSFATTFSLPEDDPLNHSHELADTVLHGIAKGDR